MSVRNELKLTAYPGSQIYMYGLELREELNRTYHAVVHCRIPDLRARHVQDLAREMRGSGAELTIERKVGSRPFTERVVGIVQGVDREGSSHLHDLVAGTQTQFEEDRDIFAIHIGPALDALAYHTEACGTFSGDTYAAILLEQLEQVLPKRKFTPKIEKNRRVDEMVWSQGQSLLEWFRAECDEAGLRYFFRHDGSVEELVLVDTNGGFDPDPASQQQAYKTAWLGQRVTEETIVRVHVASGLAPGRVEQAGFDEAGSCASISEGAALDGATEAVDYRWGPVRPTEQQDPHQFHRDLAEIHSHRTASASNLVIVESNILAMRVGRKLRLELTKDDIREYVCVRTNIRGVRSEPGKMTYECTSEVVPTTSGGASIEVTLPQAASDATMSLSLAEVVAIENKPVQVDGLMRCRIRYHWQKDKDKTPAVDVAVLQRSAGAFGGEQFIPREGDRVLVGHLHDNPRSAVILGCLYDEHGHKPPSMGPPGRGGVVPDAAQWLGWSHASIVDGSPSMSDFTTLAMDVTANQELFYVNAPGDYRLDIKRDYEVNVKEGGVSETVEGERTSTAKGGHTLSVPGEEGGTPCEFKLSAEDASFKSIGGLHAEAIEGGHTFTAKLDIVHTSLESNIILAAENGKVICQGDAEGFGALGPSDSFFTAFGDETEIRAPRSVELEGGPSLLTADDKGVKVDAPQTTITEPGGTTLTAQKGKFTVDAPQGISFKCGATTLELTPTGVVIRGGTVEVDAGDGSARVVLDGRTSHVEIVSTRVSTEAEQLELAGTATEIRADRVDVTGGAAADALDP